MRFVAVCLAVLIPANLASGQSFDFTSFTLDPFPLSTGDEPVWDITPTTATVPDGINTTYSVLYSPEDVINKRVRGFITPGTLGNNADNDYIGIVFGYQPGNALLGETSANADYILIDWKGEDQFASGGTDRPEGPAFHDLTPDGFAPVGLALSRITGVPTGDELWQHVDYDENSLGGVNELTRGVTRGVLPFPREVGASFEIDVIYLSDKIEVRIDGDLEIELEGSFPEGRFGVYTGWQSESPQFSDFQVLPPFPPFQLEVSSNGNAWIRSVAENPTELRSYSIESSSGLLDAVSWTTDNLDARDLDTVGNGPGESWQTVSGTADQLFEAFLQGGTTIQPGESLNLGRIMQPFSDTAVLGDLSFDIVSGTPGGSGDSTPDVGVPVVMITTGDGDFDGDGDVDGHDFLVWQRDTSVGELTDWQASYGTASQASTSAVPEPCTFLLLGTAIFGVALSRGR